jgi:hypothetical protein
VVSSWGETVDNNWKTDIPGHILLISRQSKEIKDFVSNTPVGNLDGIVKLDNLSFLVTERIKIMIYAQPETEGSLLTFKNVMKILLMVNGQNL